jgi:phage antirepressor YoqD-like protein
MNIAYKLEQLSLQNLFFMDSKKNIIMDGKFTKVLYSDDLLTTNGISIVIPFHNTSLDKTYNKTMLKFQTTDPTNAKLCNELAWIEKYILDYYKQITSNTKTSTTTLNDHMKNGNVKIYRDSNATSIKHVIIKISGIWEDQTRVGLTYKFMESIAVI